MNESRMNLFSSTAGVTGDSYYLSGEDFHETWIRMRGDFVQRLASEGEEPCKQEGVNRIDVWLHESLGWFSVQKNQFNWDQCSQTGGPGSHWYSDGFATYLMHNFIFRRFDLKWEIKMRCEEKWENTAAQCTLFTEPSDEQNYVCAWLRVSCNQHWHVFLFLLLGL